MTIRIQAIMINKYLDFPINSNKKGNVSYFSQNVENCVVFVDLAFLAKLGLSIRIFES